VTAQGIGTPRASAFGFGHSLSCRAEFAQTFVTGNDDLPVARAANPGIAPKDFANPSPVRCVIPLRLVRFKPRVVEELPDCPCEHETTVSIIRPWLAKFISGLPIWPVEAILPHQFIREAKTVALEVEAPRPGDCFDFNRRHQIACRESYGWINKLTMLYERWCQIAGRRPKDVALRDLSSGQKWTFAELLAAGQTHDCGEGKIAHPQGNSPEFIFSVLSAWRQGTMVSPLEAGQSPPRVSVPPAHCVHLKTTSATTGAARYVAFTAEQLAADAENIVATMGLRPDWPNLGVILMAHSYGFSNLVLPLLLHGIPLILLPSPLPEVVRLATEGGSEFTLAGVPALWRVWHNANAISRNIRLAISAGAPLLLSLEKTVFVSTGVKIHNFYGSTECGGIAYDATDSPRNEDACVGSPMQNVNLSVNENGCLVVGGRAVGETYWPTPTATLGRGRYETSDLADLKGGAVFLRGRASDSINVAGRKVSPMTIEHELIQHPAVGECMVFGVPDCQTERGDLIVACVVASSPVTGEALKHFLLERIPAWQLPRDWWFVESLLPNRVGKVSRVQWRGRYLERMEEAR
jgi:long-chain acyl-CoA synthetase